MRSGQLSYAPIDCGERSIHAELNDRQPARLRLSLLQECNGFDLNLGALGQCHDLEG